MPGEIHHAILERDGRAQARRRTQRGEFQVHTKTAARSNRRGSLEDRVGLARLPIRQYRRAAGYGGSAGCCGSPALLALRLKIQGQKLTEAETIVVHNQGEGMIFDINALNTPSK